MKRIVFILTALMAVSLNTFAAEDWRGRVIDEKGEPVAFANVAHLVKG